MTRRFVPALAVFAITISLSHCAPSAGALDRWYGEAQTQLRRGRLDEALADAREGERRAARAEDAVRLRRFRLLIADVHLTRGEIAEAAAILDESISGDSTFRALRGRQLLLQARSRMLQGQLEAAAPLLADGLALDAGDPAVLVDLQLLQSQLLYQSGRAADADVLLTGARATAAAQGDSFRLAQIANNLGLGLVTRGRYDEALPYFEGVLADRALEGTSVHAAALNNAGLCHARLGQFERAVTLQQEAIRTQSQRRRRDYAQALGEMGSTYLLQEDYARGAEYLQQAFTIAAAAGLATDAALFARNLASAYVSLNRWDEATQFHQEALRFARSAGAAVSPYAIVTEANIAAGQGRSEEAGRLFAQALEAANATPGVRWMSQEGLARLALAAHRPAEAATQFASALETVDRTRSALLRADDRISFTARLNQFYRGYVDLLLSQGAVERALEVADSSRARVLAERQGVAAPAARASAASLKTLARATDSTLLFYWLGPEQSRVWVVSGAGIHAAPLPPAAQIETLITEHQAAIQNVLSDPMAAPGSAGERLYDILMRPVLSSVKRSNVVIVPDGALHRLNFETLVVPENVSAERPVSARAPISGQSTATGRHYLIDDVTIQIAPSLAMLQHRAAAPARGSLLLVGNATARPPEFPGLTHAAAEMSGIRESFAPDAVAVFDGERASPAAFKDATPERFSVIHFTSHAVANTESPLDSAVILSGPDSAYKLYARDVAALPLKADLVTVSACRSAGERAYAGEGLVGFAWAFLRAGSRRVVAGLWDVDDRSTAALMQDLYARIAAGGSPPEALRDAKRQLMKNGYAKPYYWAPFQVFTVVI